MSTTGKGAVLGSALGAGAGYLIGDSGTAAAAGAVAGGLLGGVMGKQQGEIKSLQNQQDQAANTRVVNVSNSNGSTTPVVLRKTGVDQWQGPRGEIYNSLPSPGQLKPVYGI
jgi:hypothetical protein